MKSLILMFALLGSAAAFAAPNESSETGYYQVAPGKADGVQLGVDEDAKISFHGAVPSEQRASSSQTSVVTTASTSATNAYGYATQAQADAIVTLVNELRAALVEKGLIKGSN